MSATHPRQEHARFPLSVSMVMIDLDGTLIHTAPDLTTAANRMLADLGMPAQDPRTVSGWIGNGVPRLVKRALTGQMEAEPDPALFTRAYALYEKHYAACLSEQSRSFPGVVEGLEWLRISGFELVCITNKAEAFTLPLLGDLHLKEYFALVLSGDSLPRKKPDPMPLLHACAHFGIPPAQGILVGDSRSDVQAARAAEMPVICVAYGYNHGEDIRESGPDAVIGSLAELPHYLKRHP